ncbi:hypothetical protein [Listeria marthii]|uniref:hypothetical protein n=1 Tax=Listeria marthii TaxID=529731 RepID=UPI001625B783|nr:hypothetical protein [Listeria marthii]MBC2038459.1 hypothetical protein [Listeria marthii]
MKILTDKIQSPPWLDKEEREAFFVVKELTEIDVAGNADLHTISIFIRSILNTEGLLKQKVIGLVEEFP